MNSYPMEIKATENTYTFRAPEFERTIKCPANRMEQIKNGHYYFDKPTRIRHEIWRMVMPQKFSKTHSILASRVWNALWEEGWRNV
jgi:hypothetical protein